MNSNDRVHNSDWRVLTAHASATKVNGFGIVLGAASVVRVASSELFVGLVVT